MGFYLFTWSHPISPVFGEGVLDDLLLPGTDEGLHMGGTGSLRRTWEIKSFILKQDSFFPKTMFIETLFSASEKFLITWLLFRAAVKENILRLVDK